MNLYEKYRPTTFDDVIGQTKAVRTVQRLTENHWGGQAFWISGASGTGKTTIARIVAAMGADELCVHEYDSADQLTAEALDEIDHEYMMHGWGGKSGRAYIINEAHGLRANTIRRLLGLLERIPQHVVWVFTTTREGCDKLFDDQIDASPLLSRCHEIRLTNQGLNKLFAERAQQIATAENLNGKPIKAYEQLARDCHNNMRMMLQQISAGVMVE